jgi:tRNA threonylcarbamoyladenosine biosynthesis protein TsaB
MDAGPPAPYERAMRLLVLDGSLACCSAALLVDGVLRAEALVPGARHQPTALPPLAARMLAEAGGGAEAVAVVVGPGGFTGLRSAIALAEGLALGLGARLIGVTTGEALAAALPPGLRAGREVWAAIDTRRGRLVLERIPSGALPAGPAEPMAEAALPPPSGPVVAVGDAAPLVAARLLARGADAVLSASRLPSAAAAGIIAWARWSGAIPPRDATPLYVEPPAVRLPA